MKIKYSRDADVLIIKLREGKPSDSRDIAEGVIVHLTAKGQPLEIEILDASKVVQKKDIEVSLGGLFHKVSRVGKVKSGRDLVDSGIKALVDALGYSGAARFLRHFSKGERDYLVIQEKLFKGMDLEQISRRQKSIIEPGSPTGVPSGCFHYS
jgi:uncharacterized protein YuzE